MAIRIHHTQKTQAAKFGIMLEIVPDGTAVIATDKDGNRMSGASAKEALAIALRGLSTTDVMKTLKAAKPAAKGKKKVRKSNKLKCEGCGSTDVSADGEGGFVCEGCGETVEGEENNGRSAVKKKYKRAYKPFKGKCGDTLADKITAHVMFKPEGESKFRVDQDKLVKFAKANGVWDPAYAGRNNGLVRMSIRNRLQGKLNRKELTVTEIKWPG